MGLAQNITDEIIKLSSAQPMPVVDRHRFSGFPLHRDQAGLHEQIKSAISILQLQRSVVFVPNHSGKLAPIAFNRSRGLLLFSARAENRVANLIFRMISRKPCKVSGDELSSASNLVTSGASALSKEKFLTPDRVASRGVPSGLTLQKVHISDHRLTTFLAKTREARHSFFLNPIVNQIEQCLIRESLHGGTADDIRRVFTTEPVESMASRAFCLENVLSFRGFRAQIRAQTWRRPFALRRRVLANGSAHRTEGHQYQPERTDDSPDHVALLTIRTERHFRR